MLAKLWKKVLLAVCIIACIFNIMSKIVNRNSLEVNLKSANDGNTVFDFTRKDSNSTTPGLIEGIHEIMNVTSSPTVKDSNDIQNQEKSATDDKIMDEENESIDNEQTDDKKIDNEEVNNESVKENNSSETSEENPNEVKYNPGITFVNLF